MDFLCAHSSAPTAQEVATQLKEELRTQHTDLLLFFASAAYEPHSLATAMQEAFGSATTLGCTTAGEITTGRMLKRSVVAMALSRRAVPEFGVAILDELSASPRDASLRAVKSMESQLSIPLMQLHRGEHVGLLMIDGLRHAEEAVMDTLGDCTNVEILGGSAGDDLRFEQAYVFLNGKAVTDAGVLVVLRPASSFEVIKTQSFRPTGEKLLVTEADAARRVVVRFNDEPAAQAYAKALNRSIDGCEQSFITNPLGLIVDGEPYVRSPQRLRGQEMVFYCEIQEGMNLAVLEAGDIVADTQAALSGVRQRLGTPSGLINFHCILRTLQLEQGGGVDAYGQLFGSFPTVGCSTYGEQYVGHINQTSTMLVFS